MNVVSWPALLEGAGRVSNDFGRNLMSRVVEALSCNLGKMSDGIANPWYRGRIIRPTVQGVAETVGSVAPA